MELGSAKVFVAMEASMSARWKRVVGFLVASILWLQLGCGSKLDPEEAAAVFVAKDMLLRVQPKGEAISARFIAATWQDETLADSLYPAVIEASGFPVAHLDEAAGADSATLVLNLFRPISLGGDSLRVVAEWLIYEPGKLFWGTQYDYRLRCHGSCELLGRVGPGYLN